MKRAFASSVALLLVVGASSLFLKASSVLVPSGAWARTDDLADIRSGAAAVLLSDGVVLIVGGSGRDGRVASAERYDATGGTFTATSPMRTARANHTATLLEGGRVLVIGGFSTDGTAVGSAEIYDPAANSWTPAGTLAHPRAGHTATLLPDGRVLVAGGENAEGALASMEVYSPVYEEFALVAVPMTAARMRHAAAIAGGRVLLIGGWDGTAALATVDVYDPATNTVSSGPAMRGARAEHTATTLLDGRVLVAGGMTADGELQSAEVFDGASGTFAPTAGAMITRRRNHIALLLPHNNSVLVAGGSSDGGASATAELYRAWQDNGIFVSTGSSAAPRSWSAGSALSFPASAANRSGFADGLVLVAGGEGASSAELYGFATVKTDKDDYSPGMTVRVSGSGWQPNETVTFFLRELPAEHFARLFTIDADAGGNIEWTDLFLVEQHHLGVHFLLTAGDGVSQAQTAFTDSNPQSISVAAPLTVTVAQGATAAFGSVTIVTGGNENLCTVTLQAIPGSGTGLPAGAAAVFGTNPLIMGKDNGITSLSVSTTASTPSGTFTFVVAGTNGTGCQGQGPTPSSTITLVVSSGALSTTTSASNAMATYGDTSVALNATVAPASGPGVGTGTVAFTIKSGATTLGSVTSGTVTAGSATASFPLSGVNAGTYTIEAAYSGGAGFTTSTNMSQSPVPTLTVNKAASTTTVTCPSGPFTYSGAPQTPCSANVTGPGGLNQPLAVSHTNNLNAGNAVASANFAESGNHLGSSDSNAFTIGKADATVLVEGYTGLYDGTAHGATGTVTGVDAGGAALGTTLDLGASFTNVPGGTASWTFTGGANYHDESGTAAIVINKANATVVVTGFTGVYDAAPHGATGTVTGVDAGGAALGASLNLGASFTNVPGGTAQWTLTGGTNYTDQSGSVPIVLTKATATVVVAGYTGIYDGAPHAATGSVSGVDAGGAALGTTLSLGPSFINFPGGTANWTFLGGTNYNDQSGAVLIVINKATPVVAVSFGPSPVMFDGNPHPAAVTVTGVSGPLTIPADGAISTIYTRNALPFAGIPTLVGSYTATASFTSTNNNYTNGASTTPASLTILTVCSAFNGFFSPIGGTVEHGTGGSLTDPVRAFKLSSTIPVKFSATCYDAPLTTGTQTLRAIKYSSAGTPDAPIDASPTDAATIGNEFRLNGAEWHFNLSTKALPMNAQGIWLLEASLFDGSTYTVWVEIKR